MIAGYAFNSSADYEVLRHMKENAWYISYNIERDRKLARETCVVNLDYRLPDKKKIVIGRERFEAPECLFNPGIIDIEKPGIPEMIFDTIISCPMDNRAVLYNNIVLSGGSTMFPGYPTRVDKDLNQIFKDKVMKGKDYEHSIKINIKDSFRRKHSVFAGGSVLAGIPALDWISKADYDEKGEAWLLSDKL